MRTSVISLLTTFLLAVPVASASATTPEEEYLVPSAAQSIVQTSLTDTALSNAGIVKASLNSAEVAALTQKGFAPTPVDAEVRLLDASSTSTFVGTQWNLDRVDQVVGWDGLFHRNATGKGVDMYILDTGVYPDHQEFTGRVSPTGYGTNGSGSDDCYGHGTRVASTAAGKTTGVAPDARIISVRVIGCDGKGTSELAAEGISWIINNHQANTPAVVNISLLFSKSEALDAATQAMINDGIVVVAGAGNDARDACLSSPGNVPDILTVGYTTEGDEMASSSNSGPCVDMYAPGTGIRTAYQKVPDGFTISSGSSFSAPHVAGAAALYLERFPSATPLEVNAYLKNVASKGVVKDLPPSTLFLRTGIITDDGSTPPDTVSQVSAPQASLVLGGVSALSTKVEEQLAASQRPLVRLSGATRYDTSAAVSASVFPVNTPRVFITSGENFPDALSAAAVGGSTDIPVLLSGKNTLPLATKTELARLNPARITLVGGSSALSEDLFAETSKLFPGKVDRVDGANRYDTNVRLVRTRFQQSSTVYVVSGENFADALSASAVAGSKKVPLMLVGKNAVSSGTLSTLSYFHPKDIVIVGGESAVSADVEKQIASGTGAPTRRIAGADRYETMLLLAKELPKTTHVVVASGENFPDALSGGAAAGALHVPLLLSPSKGLTAGATTYLTR